MAGKAWKIPVFCRGPSGSDDNAAWRSGVAMCRPRDFVAGAGPGAAPAPLSAIPQKCHY
jgi:hypothetical protein